MNYINAQIDKTPAKPLRPIPQFGGSLQERLDRSPVASRIYAAAHTVGTRKVKKQTEVHSFIKL